MALKREWIPSPNYSSRGGVPVRLVVVHTAEGARTYRELGNYFGSSSAQVSSHVGIDDTAGKIGEYVHRPDKAWCQSNANPFSICVELCGFAAWTPAEWDRHPVMLENCGRWIAEECRHYGIPIQKLSASQAQSGQRGCVGHADLGWAGNDHWDPGPNFPWGRVLDIARGGDGGVVPAEPAWTPATAPHGEPTGAIHLLRAIGGDSVPPEYIFKSNHPDAQGTGGYYAVYPSGLVRRIGAAERDMLKEQGVGVKNLEEKDSGSRLFEQDLAIRGRLEKRD